MTHKLKEGRATILKPLPNFRLCNKKPFMPTIHTDPVIQRICRYEKVLQQAWQDEKGNIEWQDIEEVTE